MRKKAETDDKVPALIDSDISKKMFHKNWGWSFRHASLHFIARPSIPARLIQNFD